MIDFLFHALEGRRIDFVLGRDEIENGLESLRFRLESHGLVERFKAQPGVGRDIEGELDGSGF